MVYFPFRKHDFCNKRTTLFIILSLFILSLLFYSFTFIASGFNYHDEIIYCGSKEKWVNSFYLFTMIDTLQTMIIPFLIIAISNVMIVSKLVKKFEFRLNKTPHTTENLEIIFIEQANESNHRRPSSESNNQNLIAATSRRNVKINNSETVRILFIITTTFLLLNFPLAITKTYHFFQKYSLKFYKNETSIDYMDSMVNKSSPKSINRYKNNKNTFNSDLRGFKLNNTSIDTLENLIDNIEVEESLTKISYFIYYINFSINFFLYSFNTNQFWRNFLRIFKR